MLYVGLVLIVLPFVVVGLIGGFIEPFKNMVDCLKHGGDWEYYRDELIISTIILSGLLGLTLILIGGITQG